MLFQENRSRIDSFLKYDATLSHISLQRPGHELIFHFCCHSNDFFFKGKILKVSFLRVSSHNKQQQTDGVSIRKRFNADN